MKFIPTNLSATEAAAKIKSGELSSVELVTACLARIDATDGELHAWAYVDREGALARAEELDRIRKSGHATGLLHGVPVGLKDIIDTVDMPTERGSNIFSGRFPEDNATIVNCLLEAGAVILGKTVTTELAFVHANETRNPHNLEYSPGGSSSGSAASVAAYQVPLAIGTQTNGSVIRPASFCGTYGFKPSRGVIPRTGLLQTSNTLDQVGVFARELEDVALLADVIGRFDPLDEMSFSRPKPKMAQGVRAEAPVTPDIAWFELPFSDRYSSDMNEAASEVIDALGEAGMKIDKVAAPPAFAGLLKVQRAIHEYEIFHHQKEIFEQHWDKISSTLQPIIQRAKTITLAEYEDAKSLMNAAVEYFQIFFQDYDAILTPSALGEAPKFGEGTGDPVCSTIWTLAGLPCVSLPMLVGQNGLPIGIQLVGPYERDDRLLRTASWVLNALDPKPKTN